MANEQLNGFGCLADTVRMVKQIKVRLAGNVVCVGTMRTAYKILIVKQEVKRPFGRPGIVKASILKWIFNE